MYIRNLHKTYSKIKNEQLDFKREFMIDANIILEITLKSHLHDHCCSKIRKKQSNMISLSFMYRT